MHEQINLFGENIKVVSKAKRFEDVLKELEKIILTKNESMAYLQKINEELLEENKNLKEKLKDPNVIEIEAFKEPSINDRAFIHIFVDWIGYSMFVKDLKFEDIPKEKQDIYYEIWDKHIKPMYKEFCKTFKNQNVNSL